MSFNPEILNYSECAVLVTDETLNKNVKWNGKHLYLQINFELPQTSIERIIVVNVIFSKSRAKIQEHFGPTHQSSQFLQDVCRYGRLIKW